MLALNFHPSDLEKAVEDLSQLLEEPVEAESVKSLRQRMMDKTVCIFPASAHGSLLTWNNRFTFVVVTRSCCRTPRTGWSRIVGSGASSQNRQFESRDGSIEHGHGTPANLSKT